MAKQGITKMALNLMALRLQFLRQLKLRMIVNSRPPTRLSRELHRKRTTRASTSSTSCSRPGSFCDSSKGCCFPVTNEPGAELGIHGLWPNRNDGTYPAPCSNKEFDESELLHLSQIVQISVQLGIDKDLIMLFLLQFKDVLANMNRDWGTLACSSSHNKDFWEHEWSKHGTCSGLNQHGYFQRSIDLYNDYDITCALANAGQ